VFSDYACPYCYLAEAALAPLRAEGRVAYDMAAYELRPAGTPLPSPDAGWMRRAWQETVSPLAAQVGLEMAYPPVQARTRKAHEAVAFARERGAGVALHEAVFRAYWRDGHDIGRIDVLVELAAGVGLDRTETRVALDIDQWTERVEADRQVADRLRLEGVPAYVLQRDGRAELRVGLQREDELREWLGRT
jgi:predicted DsbA family dithiol-disulfide isomerase